jgi:hypothetical protein
MRFYPTSDKARMRDEIVDLQCRLDELEAELRHILSSDVLMTRDDVKRIRKLLGEEK